MERAQTTFIVIFDFTLLIMTITEKTALINNQESGPDRGEDSEQHIATYSSFAGYSIW